MKVGILYLMTGVGHYREAMAIKDGLVYQGYEVDMIDPIEKFSNSDSFSGKALALCYKVFIKMGTKFLETFPSMGEKGLVFQNSPRQQLFKFFINFGERLEWFIGRHFGDCLDLSRYSYLVSTHPMATRLTVGFAKFKPFGMDKIINVCVDEVGGLAGSFYKVDGVINAVNSRTTGKILERLGLKKEYIKVLGHPLDPTILKNRENIYNRVQKDLKRGRLVLGLYIGCFAPESQKNGLLSVIKEISPLLKAKRIKAKILTGNHKDFERILRLTIQKLKIEDFIEVAHTHTPLDIIQTGHSWILEDINVMFSRPSELVFYSLATGIPHITFPIMGPQEADMLTLLRRNSPTEEWKSLEGKLAAFLYDKEKLITISKKLFASNYNFDGAVKLINLLK